LIGSPQQNKKKKKKAQPSLWHTPKIEPIHKASEVSMVIKIVATPKIDKM
jgi:hypothetical protein